MRRLLIYSNVLGMFIFNEHFNIIELKPFTKKEEYYRRNITEHEIKKRYKNLQYPNQKQLQKILAALKNRKYFAQFHAMNLELTKDLIRGSFNEDQLILQTISTIEEIGHISNILVKRLREWYSYHNPEASTSIQDNEKFSELVATNKIKKDFSSIGSEFSKENLEPIVSLAQHIQGLYNLRKNEEVFLEKIMKAYCPNIVELTGTLIGAKLLEKAGSLKKLSMMPASTVQLLGAEKALFRHLKNKKNLSPKFGWLHEHPLVSKAKGKDKGKAARILADKISIAARVDYFKGTFVADKLKKELQEKFGAW